MNKIHCHCRLTIFRAFYLLLFLVSVPASGQEFQLVVGGPGFTADAVQWPGGEGPENVINQEGQKYLNFTRENSGFYIRPTGPNSSDVPTSITLWTANDAVPRDPASYQLFGSNSADLLDPLDYLQQDSIPFDLFTEISFGDLDLPDSRNEGGVAELDDFNSQTIDFNNSTAYENYLVLFPEVKDFDAANSMQIAEVQLNYDGFDVDSGVFDFDDSITGVAYVEFIPPEPPEPLAPLIVDDYKIVVGGTSGPVDWPGAEGPENAINWEGQKYLNFNRENTGIFVSPEGPNADDVPTSITFWPANDAVERDPASFRLFGSSDSDLLLPTDYEQADEILLESFTEIAAGNLNLPGQRNAGGDAELTSANSQTIEFSNTDAFDNYVVVFPTVKDGATANSMQIAEIQLNYDGFDLDSGVFDTFDPVTGVTVLTVDGMVDPTDPVDPIGPLPRVPIRPISVGSFDIVVGGTEDPVRWPAGEGPENAINGEGQKYLNFEKENTGVLIRPEGDNADDIATSITFWTANDAEARDPASFRLFGSNSDDLDFPLDYDHEDTIPLELFTEITNSELSLPESRNGGGNAELDDSNSVTIEFENDNEFETYLVVFPTVKDADAANSMQIAELQLNYDGIDIESGIFDSFDEITGIALFRLEGTCNPDTLGDIDEDGVVAFSDFLILSSNFGQDADLHGEGDVDCNGIVEFADFLTLSSNFGQTVGRTSSVPEPNSHVCLVVIAICGILTRRRRD